MKKTICYFEEFYKIRICYEGQTLFRLEFLQSIPKEQGEASSFQIG
jgi:hypothetical protein